MQVHKRSDWVDDALVGLPPLLTASEVIALLRTTRRNFYRLVALGCIRTVRPKDAGSSRHLIAKTEVARYLRSLEAAA